MKEVLSCLGYWSIEYAESELLGNFLGRLIAVFATQND